MSVTFATIAAEIRRRIDSGEYPEGKPLPAERVLGAELKVHRATLRRALARLESEGIIFREPGERPYPVQRRPRIEGSIGLFAATYNDPYARSLIANGIAAVLRERGSRLRLVWTDNHAFAAGEHDDPSVDSLLGLVVWPPTLTDLGKLRAVRKAVPVVLVDRQVAGFEADFVGFQDFEGGYAVTKHLYELGHRRIAFVGLADVETSIARLLGYDTFCHDAGLEPCRGYEALVRIETLPAEVRAAYLSIPKDRRPTALVCENDETAARLIPHLVEAGIRVPGDIALVGFGGAQPVLLEALGLTTMVQPFVEVGREAARILLDRLETAGSPSRIEKRLPMALAEGSARLAVR